MKIKYKFVTKEQVEIEVDDTIGQEIKALSRKIHANNKYQKRLQHTHDIEKGNDDEHPNNELADDDSHFADNYFLHEKSQHDITMLKKAMATLSVKQKDLIRRVFFNGETQTQIALAYGVSISAINQQLDTVYKKLRKNFFEKP